MAWMVGVLMTCGCVPADLLPSSWTLGDAGPPVYSGMALTHFICRNCKWSAAADPGLQFQRDLTWIDISYNPLAAPYDTLPSLWDELPLVTLKVCSTCAVVTQCIGGGALPNPLLPATASYILLTLYSSCLLLFPGS